MTFLRLLIIPIGLLILATTGDWPILPPAQAQVRIPGPGGVPATGGGASIAHVATAKNPLGTAATSRSVTVATQIGDTVLVLCGGATSTASAPSGLSAADNGSNAYTQSGFVNNPYTNGNIFVSLYWAHATNTATSVTCSTSNSQFWTPIVSRFTGLSATQPDATAVTATGESGTPTSANITTATANVLLVSVNCKDYWTGAAWTAGTDFTIPTNGEEGNSSFAPCALEYRIVSSTGTYSSTINAGAGGGGTDNWSTVLGAFKQ